MNPIALGGPAVEPVSLAEAKAYLRLDGVDEDEVVSALIRAARLAVENRTRLRVPRQGWRHTLRGWPAGRRVRLPLHPIIAVEAVSVSEAGGEMRALAPASYVLDRGGGAVHLVVAPGAPEPGGLSPRIDIDLVCGFGDGAEAVPEPLRLAIRRLVAFWFEHRGDERRAGEDGWPADIDALLAPYTRPRLA